METKNESNNHSNSKQKKKHPENKKLKLLKQLEFYFSDVNLLNDKFLRKLIKRDEDSGVDISILLNFNKIKEILQEAETDENKLKYIKKAIDFSKILKLVGNKVVRVNKFDTKKPMEDFENMSIYVQNLPKNITHEKLSKIFSRCGKVMHVSIPKFSDKKPKGFAFVIYKTQEEAEKAIREMNNVVPLELIENNSDEKVPLEILSKKEWLEKKQEFKKLKVELQKENIDIFSECLGQNHKDMSILAKGTVIRLLNLPENVNKNDIKIWVSHFVEPAYVDYNQMTNDCLIRFSHKILADSFVNKLTLDENFKFKNKQITAIKLNLKEEEEYFKRILELRNEFKNKMLNKKKTRK